MQLSREELIELKSVDVRTVDPSTLVRLESVKVDPNASHEERLDSYVEQIKNPYCYLDGDSVIKITFSNSGRPLEDCILQYLRGL